MRLRIRLHRSPDGTFGQPPVIVQTLLGCRQLELKGVPMVSRPWRRRTRRASKVVRTEAVRTASPALRRGELVVRRVVIHMR